MKRLESTLQSGDHPMLGGFIDESLSLLYDYNQVLRVNIGTISSDGTILVLDTDLNEIALVTEDCGNNSGCLTGTGNYWQPRNNTLIDGTSYTGTIDYFYLQHMSEVLITGMHYGEDMCF